MAETQNNKPVLNRKEWQTMMPAITATAAGAYVIGSTSSNRKYSLLMSSSTVHYLYDHHEDDWIPIISGALGGTFGAGSCGIQTAWSINYTATGGSTTTVTVLATTHNLDNNVVGDTIEFLTGTAGNIGLRRVITAIKTNAGIGTITLTLDVAVPSPVANSDTFRISSGSFFAFNAGTLSATSFKRYDVASGTWTALSVTGLPATWGTDGRLVRPYAREESFDSGAATIGNKIWVKNLSTEGKIKWLYCLQSTSSNLRRIMLF